MRLQRFLSPGWLIAIPAVLSLLVWAVPGESLLLRGFDDRAEPELGGILLLIAWYVSAILIAVLGVAIGGSIRPLRVVEREQDNPSFERIFSVAVTLIAIVGIIGTYVIVQREHSMIDAIVSGTTNVLSQDLQSGASIATLRYATIIAAPISLFLWLKNRRSVPYLVLTVLNGLLLLFNALLSSRLSLFMAIIVFVFMYFQSKPDSRLKVVPVAIVGVVVVALLTVFNYVRNYNYYEALGVVNPLEMNFYQVAAYVGAPAQVSMGMANGIVAGRYPIPADLLGALSVLVPTFLSDSAGRSDRAISIDAGAYGFQVDIAPNLNANSVFAEVFSRYGWWGLAFALVAVLIAGAGFGYLRRYGSVVAAGAGILAYGFVDFWRSYLFNTGLLIFVLLLVAGATITALVVPRIAQRIRQPRKE